MGRIIEAGGARVTLHAYAPNVRQPRHAHDETTISLVIAGSIRERVRRCDVVARPLSVVVKPGGTEHATEFGPDGARTLQISLGRTAAAEVNRQAAQLGAWRWTHVGPAVPAFLRLLALVTAPVSAAADTAVFDVLSAVATGNAGATAGSASPPRWLADVRDEIDDRGADAISVRSLAARAGVHPVYLARAFRRAFGCSITEYVQARRVQLAAALIERTRASLAQISHEAGFADQSHLCRSFRRRTAMTPAVFRAFIGARA